MIESWHDILGPGGQFRGHDGNLLVGGMDDETSPNDSKKETETVEDKQTKDYPRGQWGHSPF